MKEITVLLCPFLTQTRTDVGLKEKRTRVVTDTFAGMDIDHIEFLVFDGYCVEHSVLRQALHPLFLLTHNADAAKRLDHSIGLFNEQVVAPLSQSGKSVVILSLRHWLGDEALRDAHREAEDHPRVADMLAATCGVLLRTIDKTRDPEMPMATANLAIYIALARRLVKSGETLLDCEIHPEILRWSGVGTWLRENILGPNPKIVIPPKELRQPWA